MQVIVPLAGPDFVGPDGGVKALHDIGEGPILRQALSTRAWAGQVTPEAYSFVLYDRAETRAFARDHLAAWYPGCRVSFISSHTSGAALSALAGVAPMLGAAPEPVVVDLADILHSSADDPAARFAADPGLGGIAWTFESDNPVYSYLRRDSAGRVVEAAEKRVISPEASAGTYAFASGPVLLRAVAHALENAASQTWRDLFFVCPLFNGVLDQGLGVETIPVQDVHDIKTA